MSGRSSTRVVDGRDPSAVAEAAACLERGELVVFPTDTVYGVGARIDQPEAVSRLFHVKGRPLERAIPVLVSDVEQVARLSTSRDPRLTRLMRAFWPGALTIVVPAADWVPREIVRETGHVGLRMPDHSLARAIIRASGGALATTSANRSGLPEACDAREALDQLGGRVELIVDGGRSPGGVPSTVIRLSDDGVEVLRAGGIDPSTISEVLRERW